MGQLKSATLKNASQAVLKSYTYDYDGAGNRTLEAIDSLVTGDTLNNLNQLTSRQGGTGVMPIRGTTNESSTVTVNGSPASVKADNTFEGKAAVTAGNNTVTVVATDVNSNTTTNRYNVAVTGSGSKTLVYDANGNLTGDGTRTFEWDPMNRLTGVNSGTNRSEFTYNGLSQRVKIVEKTNGSVTSTKQLVWCPGDAQPCEERDASNNVTKRYYVQGMQIGTTNYYYTRDHLGSLRELTNGSGTVQTRYDYDSYGRRTKISGTLDADFGFTGYYYHQPSGLNLALYRAYDVDLGRWLSRDPFEEGDGPNVYAYVGNDPISRWDRFGLEGAPDFREKFWAVFETGYATARTGYALAQRSSREAQRSGLPGPLNGPQDAYRHCIWSCLMAQNLGEGSAKAIADNHENRNDRAGQSAQERKMDEANNAAGRRCGKDSEDKSSCEDKCRGLLNSGNLYGLGGAPMSPPR